MSNNKPDRLVIDPRKLAYKGVEIPNRFIDGPVTVNGETVEIYKDDACDKCIGAIVSTAESIYSGAVAMCEEYGYSDSVMGSEIDKLFGLELLCVWLGNRELDERISLMREKLRGMKNNKPEASEAEPVKGGTAKDGGRECCTCGKVYPFTCECGGF